MERFGFGEDVVFVPLGDLLDGVTTAPLTQPTEEGGALQGSDLSIRARRSRQAASRH
jgi:hypothetical protein